MQKILILVFLFVSIIFCIPSQSKAFCVSGACFQDLRLKGMPRGGGGGGYVPAPTPSGPSPEELRREREEKDLREAADDANDKAVEFAERGDWDTAIRYLTEALEYEPDDELIQNNLRKVQEYKRKTAVVNEKKALIEDLQRKVASDEHAIGNLGFDKRAKDFEEWEKLSSDARKEFEEQMIDSLVELLLAGASEGNKTLIKGIGSTNTFSAQKLIGKLNSAGIRNKRIWQLIREVGATKNKPQMAKATRELIELMEKESDLFAIAQDISKDPAKIKTQAEAVVTLLSWGLHGPFAGFLASDVQFMFASVYNNASRRVSMSNIERLTILTEEELKSLKNLSSLLKNHVDQLNRAKKDLAALSGLN